MQENNKLYLIKISKSDLNKINEKIGVTVVCNFENIHMYNIL